MRIFVTGPGGAAGARLVRQPIEHGYQVIRNHRSPGTAGRVGALGAEPIALNQPTARVWRRLAGSS